MASKEIKSLTGIRGLAAVYVIIFHWNVEISQKMKLSDFTGNIHFFKSIINHGYLSVDLFFILSGFVLSLSSHRVFTETVSFGEDYKTFMFKRFFRIFPLYICMTVLYYSLFDRGSFANFLVNLTLLQGIIPFFNDSVIPPGWSLTNEWVIYFIFPFLFHYLIKFRNKAWVLICVSLLILILISILRAHFINWANYTQLSTIKGFNPVVSYTRGPASFLRTIVSYLLGVFAFMVYDKKKNYSNFKYAAIAIIVLLFFNRSDILIILLMPFLILYLTEVNYLSKFFSSKVVYFLGLISYSLYVNHYLFIESYMKVSKMIGINNNAFSFCYVVTGTLIFSIITYYAIEKPGMSFLKNNEIKLKRNWIFFGK